ncbi:solute carrier organic anion transporter family member 1C1-like isoform X1 [Polypterus senegalus]|uniref:solute carrier organic anion transporter family member 1C1-like isoform X1 n=1 Tax=Polypterus senegalus TaxID=55291 RepID=UPI00196455B1|nr:solute carrier organic anion transporter family member 1C1-like isoform X1 [Polypterus senegalus]
MPRDCIMETSSKENGFSSWAVHLPVKQKSISFFHRPQLCFSQLKMFLMALSFAYFAKALSGSYMKSTITQLERRFDIPSYLIGVVDGSFEIGNLLVIAFVSYFGAKMHRPKIIGAGCLLMALGTFLIAMPHFLIGRYKFESAIGSSLNSSNTFSPCSLHHGEDASGHINDQSSVIQNSGCEKEAGLSTWIYVFLGNMLRGIGETPIQPLGISYVDDFALEENAAFYIGCVQTISIIGPVFGFLLGSLCAGIFVDVGFVEMDSVTITPADSRWVGAWWLGYLIAGVISLLSAVPFWFLPKSLPDPRKRRNSKSSPEKSRFIKQSAAAHKYIVEEPVSFTEMAKDFIPSLKGLLGNPIYFLYLCITIVQFNSLIGMVTYKPKYIEQHYGQSASKANFIIGAINIPAVALGIFSGGVVMKKLKLNVIGAARFALGTSVLGFVISLTFFAMGCENSKVAGLTVSYEGIKHISYFEKTLSAGCNSDCFCSVKRWDPVCGSNGITYISPCLAGCKTSRGSGKSTVFDNCQCLELDGFSGGNISAVLGECQKREDCDKIFPYFLALSVISSFVISLGGTPGYILLIRCIKPELKSLALGFHTLITRTLAGIPAPIYFGALIDATCLKWGSKKCGGRGACRIYDTNAYRIVYLGLTLGLRTFSYFFCVIVYNLLKKQCREESQSSLAKGGSEAESLRKDDGASFTSDNLIYETDCYPEKETCL